MAFQVRIIQGDRVEEFEIEQKMNLYEIINQKGFKLTAYCGGEGTCKKCRVHLQPAPELKNIEREIFSEREKEEGLRLACLHQVDRDLEIRLDTEGDINVLTGTAEVEGRLNSGWSLFEFELEKPRLDDQRSYLTRYLEKTGASTIADQVIKDIKALDAKIKALKGVCCQEELVELIPDSEEKNLLGVAVDIGTTTLVLYLYDLETGEKLGIDSMYNPQKEFGADVISRIQFANKSRENAEKLQQVLVERLNQGLTELVAEVGAAVDDIYRIAFAGNTTMLHTLLGFDPIDIAKSPFIPNFTEGLNLSPELIDLKINSRAELLLLPSISAYIGADIIGDLLATGVGEDQKNELLIDIGTNGEIALGNSSEIYTCSVAAGPSFEGSNISAGMAALAGAVEKFSIRPDSFDYQTINAARPRGICGSGLLDLIAGFLEVGVIAPKGKFTDKDKMPEYWQERFDQDNKEVIIFSEEEAANKISLTQKDIRQLQLAKGAIRAGIEVLAARLELSLAEIDKVYLVGGFANYLDPDNTILIGMLPEIFAGKIIQFGNGSGAGASLYLLDRDLAEIVEQLKERIKYIELSKDADFQEKFIEELNFPGN
ncbi:MAG: ASKHA domain-containing protein [Halarsenatibacteraceae bacterium]